MRGLDSFNTKKILIYSNLIREREKEWDLGKSIHCQKKLSFCRESTIYFRYRYTNKGLTETL